MSNSMRGSRLGRCFIAIAIIGGFVGCVSLRRDFIAKEGYEATAMEAAKELDAIAAAIEETGTILVSTAPLMPNDDKRFAGDFKWLTPEEIFKRNENRIEAQSTVRSQKSLSLDGKVNVVTDPSGVVTSQPSEDSARRAEGALSSDKFAAPLATPDPKDLAFNLRKLIQLTFDDYTTIKILEALSRPDSLGLKDDWIIMPTILNVSIQPGRLTYRDYIGQIDVQIYYGYEKEANRKKKSTYELIERAHPLAFAIFPTLDAQLVDERTSQRRQFAASLLAAIAGSGAAGGLDADYVERLEQDVATRTMLNTVTCYNAGGRHFGWTFSPPVVAQADPSAIDTHPERMLQPQSFPALVLIAIERSEIDKSCGGDNAESESRPTKDHDCNPATHLVIRSSMRWMRAPNPTADDSWVPGSEVWDRWGHDRLTEEHFMDWAIRLHEVREKIRDIENKVKGEANDSKRPEDKASAWGNPIVETLKKRVNLIESQSVGYSVYVKLPKAKKPPASTTVATINDVSPSTIWCGEGEATSASVGSRGHFVVIKGSGLLKNAEINPPSSTPQTPEAPAVKSAVYIGATQAKVVYADPAGTINVVEIEKVAPTHAGTYDVSVVSSLGAAIARKAIEFKVANHPDDIAKLVPPAPKAEISIKWDTTGTTPRIQSIVINGEVSAAQIVEAIKSSAPAGSGGHTINVNATENH